MRAYKYKKVNAFTSSDSQGNPAAYLLVEGDVLTNKEMLRVGEEHSGFVSEVVFCTDSDKADKKLTYYSSECEVDFCGHGTVATMYDLIQNDEKLRVKAEITIETNKKGILTVYNCLDSEDAVYISAPTARYLKLSLGKQKISEALGIKPEEIEENMAVDFIDAGLRTLIVPIVSLEKEISIYPNEKHLKEFCLANEIDIILIFCKETSNAENIAHTRVFAPKFGYLEDPATGSGNSAFANYLLKNELWNGDSAMVEQGGDNIAFNQIMIKMQAGNILFGGKATVVIDGKIYISEK